MTRKDALKVYFVVGETSGDVLGASLLAELRRIQPELEAVGLAGRKMQAMGVNSLFDISDISVMGFSAVVARLPKLIYRIHTTVRDVLRHKPDVLILIDSPDFSYRVAKQVRTKMPCIRIVKYVAPSVWAWRPGRARKISAYIDHVLAILPFEPEVLSRLGGPPATYVGHPLSSSVLSVGDQTRKKPKKPPCLVVLPGSRASEVSRLMPVIGATLRILAMRDNIRPHVILPAVEHLLPSIKKQACNWEIIPEIIIGDEARHEAFLNADFALAASGTVTLELAIYKVPTIAIYKLDFLAMRFRHLFTGWTASLPNLIADYPVVPEMFNEFSRPGYIARMLERLCEDSHERNMQIRGFELVIERLRQKTPASEMAARIILEIGHTH